ncbi:MAG: hypothetical protein JWP36_2416, partial [Paucimonas sp.]|nr:hypothetical protein [Paucimonas sp.]
MNPETGSLISRAAVLRLLQSALPCGHLPQATNADDTLHDLGLDSI